MAQQEGGWPLGLQPLNVRVGLLRNLDFSGSLSLNTIITDDSPTSSSSASSSSDIDTESSGSFFRDQTRSITLGNLIGITNILELSRRSLRRSKKKQEKNPRRQKTHKTKTWLFSLCPRAHLNHETPCSSINAPSLGHFLEAERRASNVQGRKKKKKKKKKSSSMVYEIDELIIPERVSSMEEEENSLFSNGVVPPPPPPPPPPPHEVEGNEGVVSSNTSRGLIYENGCCFALMFPCLGGVSV